MDKGFEASKQVSLQSNSIGGASYCNKDFIIKSMHIH